MKSGILAAVAVGAAVTAIFVIVTRPPDSTGPPDPVTAEKTRLEAPSLETHVLVGAGDIGDCQNDADEATAELLDEIEGTVFTLGDNAYPDGELDDFEDCYHPSWGRHLDRTRPSPGNHEYFTEDAAGYFEYFGDAAAEGYYAYDLGDWRIYSLNSEDIDDDQLEWLAADLREHPRECVLAYWHSPLVSSGGHGGSEEVAPLWRALYQAGAEVVLNAHEHNYERFAPLGEDGTPRDGGVRQFIVGTGGGGLNGHRDPEPGSEVRWSEGHGVLKLELRPGEYTWEFVSVPGSGFRDSGTGDCR